MRMLNRLSSRRVATEKKPGLHADGGGLYLQVAKGGTRSWIFRFSMDGKTRDMGLGSIKATSLSAAREMARKHRETVALGIDPIRTRKDDRTRRRLESASAKTFKECALGYLEDNEDAWKSAKHARQWTSTLETYVYPVFGNLPVNEIMS